MKRLMDFVLALVGLILLSPVLAVVAVLVRRSMGSPVFFVHERPGLHGRPFRMVKFRTMRDPTPEEAASGRDGARITPLGRTLRKTSLDELPELWNVLKGDMSLVGPRPLLMSYLTLYSPRQARRHEVRPGITGWAQVNGRNAVSWEEKFEMDVWYVENRNLILDLKILFLTVLAVVAPGRNGIEASAAETMPRFTGSNTSETKE